MRDLSFEEALNDPEMPFQAFVKGATEVWNRAVEIYEQAGSPNGPADEGDNVTRWVLSRIEVADAIASAEELFGLDHCDE